MGILDGEDEELHEALRRSQLGTDMSSTSVILPPREEVPSVDSTSFYGPTDTLPSVVSALSSSGELGTSEPQPSSGTDSTKVELNTPEVETPVTLSSPKQHTSPNDVSITGSNILTSEPPVVEFPHTPPAAGRISTANNDAVLHPIPVLTEFQESISEPSGPYSLPVSPHSSTDHSGTPPQTVVATVQGVPSSLPLTSHLKVHTSAPSSSTNSLPVVSQSSGSRTSAFEHSSQANMHSFSMDELHQHVPTTSTTRNTTDPLQSPHQSTLASSAMADATSQGTPNQDSVSNSGSGAFEVTTAGAWSERPERKSRGDSESSPTHAHTMETKAVPGEGKEGRL